jgi:hypothetical protein
MTTEVTKDTLFDKVKECKQIIINDTVYFGTIKKIKGGYEVEGVRSEGTVENDVRKYIKTDNLNQLDTITVSGQMVSISEKPLTDDQLDEALVVCVKAARAQRSAVAELINTKF